MKSFDYGSDRKTWIMIMMDFYEEKCLEFRGDHPRWGLGLSAPQALTDLCLINSVLDDSECLSTYPVVDLPCLRVLRISSGVTALTAVLRHITITHSTVLILTCRENQSAQIDFSNLLSVVATKFLSSLVIRSLSLQVPVEHAYGLEF